MFCRTQRFTVGGQEIRQYHPSEKSNDKGIHTKIGFSSVTQGLEGVFPFYHTLEVD